MTSDTRTWTVRAVATSGSVYGTILASSIVVGLGYRSGDALVMIAVLVVTELVFAMAQAWSALLARGAERGGLPSGRDLGGRCATSGRCCRPPGRRCSPCCSRRSASTRPTPASTSR